MPSTDREWWRGAAIYQIYPRSFLDSSGNGVGDLRGITKRLDYVGSLGVAGFWISPFFTSPMKDFGYDVADYCDVDPIFGTLKDFDRLIAKAHKLGLKVIIDQVYSHTSDEHPWFTESRAAKKNSKADWYVWADPKKDGTPPNNWQSVFAGPAWTWDARREQYYMHNFLPEQPDLNLHNPRVQRALLDAAKFWLERGVDGFRIDAINHGMHDLDLRSNPVAKSPHYQAAKPFLMQEPKYTTNHPDMPKFLAKLRRLTNQYGEIFTVAEVGGVNPLATQKAYTANNRHLNSAYGFEYLGMPELTATSVKNTMNHWPGDAGEGWPSWAFSNHDAPRVASRWLLQVKSPKRAKLLALLQIALRGNIFIYQGEELGLPQAEVPFDRIQDPEALSNWPQTLGRDGARTPFPWDSDQPHAGFSKTEPWLPISPQHRTRSVQKQEADSRSTLNFFRKAIALRNQSSALSAGDVEWLSESKSVLVFMRRSKDGELAICAFNLTNKDTTFRHAALYDVCNLMAVQATLAKAKRELKLPAYSAFVGIALNG